MIFCYDTKHNGILKVEYDQTKTSQSMKIIVDESVLLLLLLFEIRNRIVPTGSTPKGGPTEFLPLPSRPLVTPGPCLSLCSLSPHTFVMNASCIRSVPSPVLLSYTYTLSSLWSVSSLSFCPTHIFKPHRKEPLNIFQTPQTNYVNSLSQ